DIDNHYYEPYDAFTRHMEPAFRDHAVNIRKGRNGLGQIWIGDRRLASASVTQTDWIGAPGSMRAYFAGMEEKFETAVDEDAARIGGLQDVVIDPKQYPEFMNRDARLAKMDAQNLDAVLMLPTLGCTVEYELGDDPAVAAANMRAFNRWLEQDWGYNYRNRILAAPMFNLADLDAATAELDRVLAAGAKAVLVRTGPAAGRSPGDPYFDPFWARIAEAGVPVGLHIGDSGFCEIYSAHWGENPRPPVHKQTAFQVYTAFMERPISDTLAALILHNLFARFPGIQVMSIENGAGWVPALLRGMDKAWRSAKGRTGLGGEVAEKPSQVFRRNVHISPFPEDDIPALMDRIGAHRVLFGSDYPHPEGIAEPADFADELAHRDPAEVRLVMRDNSAALLGL
ncbi:MAG TPA: amidohydrolase family protein, partial [Pseudonocardia sp.]